MDPIFEQAQEIFRDVFEDDHLELREDIASRDIPAWDSLAHVTLLVSLERAFGIRFSTSEINRLENAGSILALIRTKLGSYPA